MCTTNSFFGPPPDLAAPRLLVHNFVVPFVESGTWTIVQIQKHRTPSLDSFFKFSTASGNVPFYVLFLPMPFFFGRDEFGRALSLLLCMAIVVCNFLKDYACCPRPRSPPVVSLSTGHMEYGWPSTHAASAVALAFYAAISLTVPWTMAWFLAIMLALLHTFIVTGSRLYLGMHTPVDLIGGLVVGIVLLLAWSDIGLGMASVVEDWVMTGSFVPSTCFVVGAFVLQAHPVPVGHCPCFLDSINFVGAVSSVCAMSSLVGENPWLRMDPPASLVIGLLRILLGTVVIAISKECTGKACEAVCPLLFPLPRKDNFYSFWQSDNIARFVRYASLSTGLMIGCPLVFMAVGL